MDAASWRKAAKPVLIHSYLSWSGYRVLDKPHIISFHFLRGPCWAWDTRPTIWFKIPIFRLRAKGIVGKLECCLDKTLWSEQSMREIFYLVSNSCFPGIFFLISIKDVNVFIQPRERRHLQFLPNLIRRNCLVPKSLDLSTTDALLWAVLRTVGCLLSSLAPIP